MTQNTWAKKKKKILTRKKGFFFINLQDKRKTQHRTDQRTYNHDIKATSLSLERTQFSPLKKNLHFYYGANSSHAMVYLECWWLAWHTYYPGQNKKKRPLRLCIKSEHGSHQGISKNQASVCSDARSRGQPRHRASLRIMLIMLILRDKNSVLILCII